VLPLAASAATIHVTSTADNATAGNGRCTLREATQEESISSLQATAGDSWRLMAPAAPYPQYSAT